MNVRIEAFDHLVLNAHYVPVIDIEINTELDDVDK